MAFIRPCLILFLILISLIVGGLLRVSTEVYVDMEQVGELERVDIVIEDIKV